MRGRPKGSKNIYPSDTQRERLYLAERQMPEFVSQDFESLKEVELFIKRFMKTKAWTSRCRVDRFILKSTSREYASADTYGKTVELNMPKWAWTKMVVAHELAHAMCKPRAGSRAKHGREFAGTYLYLVGKMCGKDVKDRLKQEFFKQNVDWAANFAS